MFCWGGSEEGPEDPEFSTPKSKVVTLNINIELRGVCSCIF